MPLPPPDIAREPLHTRSIRVESFAREDGQWDLEAELIDVKAYDFPERSGAVHRAGDPVHHRSEEHTSELQSLMRISYAVFCLKKNNPIYYLKRYTLTKQ